MYASRLATISLAEYYTVFKFICRKLKNSLDSDLFVWPVARANCFEWLVAAVQNQPRKHGSTNGRQAMLVSNFGRQTAEEQRTATTEETKRVVEERASWQKDVLSAKQFKRTNTQLFQALDTTHGDASSADATFVHVDGPAEGFLCAEALDKVDDGGASEFDDRCSKTFASTQRSAEGRHYANCGGRPGISEEDSKLPTSSSVADVNDIISTTTLQGWLQDANALPLAIATMMSQRLGDVLRWRTQL